MKIIDKIKQFLRGSPKAQDTDPSISTIINEHSRAINELLALNKVELQTIKHIAKAVAELRVDQAFTMSILTRVVHDLYEVPVEEFNKVNDSLH